MYHYFCSFVEDESTRKEIRNKVFGWGFFLFVSLMIVGMFAALITGGVYGLNIENYALSTYNFVMSAAFVIPCVQLICLIVKHFRKNDAVNTINTHFYDDCVIVNDSLRINYVHIYKVSQTQNYILLHIHEPNKPYKYLPIKKDSLNCNPETLVVFIKAKHKEAKTVHFMPAH